MATERNNGYSIEDEDKESLIASAVDFAFESMPLADDPPVIWDPRPHWRVENQGSVGRCAGMAASSVAEICYHRQLPGADRLFRVDKWIHFNGHFSYIRAQSRTKRLYGRDRGSPLPSNVLAAKEDGFCPIDWNGDGTVDYPMPRRYTTKLPEGAMDLAQTYKVGYHAYLETFDGILQFLRSGQGGVFVGGPWGKWRPRNGVCNTFKGGGSGHAWAILGWDISRQTVNEDVLLAVNSHGKRSWTQGWTQLTRNFIRQFADHPHTVIAGMSDLSGPEPRKIQWRDDLQWV